MEENVDITNEYFKKIGSLVKEIDRKQEATLWKRVKKGNKDARDKLMQMHLRLVIPTAKRFLRPGVELMDLIEEGNLGLLQAIKKFDYKLGYRFSTYAIHWIEQFIRRAVEEQGNTIKIPAHAWENLRAWGKAWDKLKTKYNREPTLKEMSVELKISARQVRSILDTLNAAYSIDSLSTNITEEEGLTLEDTITDDGKGDPDDLFSASSDNKELVKILSQIPPRDKQVLLLRYGVLSEEPYTLAEVAKKLKISRERVRQIEERAVRQVRKQAEVSGLIEAKNIKPITPHFYNGMPIKQKTNILGDKITDPHFAKLLKRATVAVEKIKNNKFKKKGK